MARFQILTGKRYSAPAAVKAGFVDAAVQDEVQEALNIASAVKVRSLNIY